MGGYSRPELGGGILPSDPTDPNGHAREGRVVCVLRYHGGALSLWRCVIVRRVGSRGLTAESGARTHCQWRTRGATPKRRLLKVRMHSSTPLRQHAKTQPTGLYNIDMSPFAPHPGAEIGCVSTSRFNYGSSSLPYTYVFY